MDPAGSLIEQKNIAILGSTGSIGRSTLDVISRLKNRFTVRSLAAGKNIALLHEQIRLFSPACVAVLDRKSADQLRSQLDGTTEVLAGEDGLMELAGRSDTDFIVNAIVGSAGLRPTLHALETGKDVALANKETLVAAGEIVMQTAHRYGRSILPIDSEHSAILQCLRGEKHTEIRRLILTASGGPFLNHDTDQLMNVTVEEALNHPTWSMGTKITVDSATLMNKGLEVIEACRLFGLPPDRVEVVIHPQSIIHSMVEFADGSVKAQMGMPDMRMPIQYALTYPERPDADFRPMDITSIPALTFMKPDTSRFPCLRLAYRALEAGGTAPAVLNAANEVAVELFLDRQISFNQISDIIAGALDSHSPGGNQTIEDVIAAERSAREAIHRTFLTKGVRRSGDPIRHSAAM